MEREEGKEGDHIGAVGGKGVLRGAVERFQMRQPVLQQIARGG
jgi:hypothetical protein